jgi:hypothetical protein
MVPYPKFVRFVKQVFCLTVRRTRLENLHLLAYGLLQGRSCCLSRIARFFPLPTEHTHRLRRLWRFLTNPHFIPEQVYPQLIRALAPRWPAQLPMPLAVDWTRAAGLRAAGGRPALAGPRSARVGCRLRWKLAGDTHESQPPGTCLHRRRHLGAARGAPPDAPGVDRRSRLRPAESLPVPGFAGGGLLHSGQRQDQDRLEGAEPLAL